MIRSYRVEPPPAHESMFIGVDPGLAVGLACYVTGPREIRMFSSWVMPPYEAGEWLEKTLVTHRRVANPAVPVTIGCERYIITPKTMSQQHDALEVIGVVRYLARKYDARLLVQGAGDAQRMGNDARLRRIDWRRDGDHRDRAAAQLLLALARVAPSEAYRLTSSGSIRST